MHKFILVAVTGISVLACNSSADTSDHQADSAGHDHAGHSENTVQMPPMPEVPAGATVFFVNLKDGQTVTSPVHIKMGVEGMSVDTANGILKPASGHHHILVGLDSVATETVIPKDSVHIHFGNAQKEAEITLPPGKHTLTLQFADALHRSYGTKLSSSVTVMVKE